VLVRGKIGKTGTHPIEPSPGHEPRVILDATVELPSCGSLRLLATHFDHRSAADRMRGARLANKLASGLPAVLAGDLNARPDAEEIRELAAEWSIAGEGQALLTIPVATPARQIDYILFRPAQRWRVVEVKVLKSGSLPITGRFSRCWN
jgi:endonuclease/exonuclease/phosphatase family metal-dependent hydrolase